MGLVDVLSITVFCEKVPRGGLDHRAAPAAVFAAEDKEQWY